MPLETGAKVGPWTLGPFLGHGGNASVWEATRDPADAPVALKVINTTKSDRESYRRFVQEITFLRRHVDEEGVLPLIDSHLPDQPSARSRPWLAMPIATPIRAALDDCSLELVVAAVGEIAATLARLAAQTVGHRDIKPGNLYRLNERWLVGDFGLVAAPDMDEMTREGQALGPAHFTAYEMILDPASADPLPADVYSLGKTLWVLATRQLWPPEGHQVAGTRGFSIAELRPHANADALDRLIDRATRIHPEERPTMEEVASDLRAWHELKGPPEGLDVSALRTRFRAKMEHALAAEDLVEQRKELAHAASRRLLELLAPLNEALKAMHPRPQINVMPDKNGRNMLRTYRSSGAPDFVFEFGRMSRIAIGDHFPFQLVFGSGIELTSKGALLFHAFIDVGHDGLGGSSFSWGRQPAEAPVGSVEADRMLEAGVTELQEALAKALEVFVAETPEQPG